MRPKKSRSPQPPRSGEKTTGMLRSALLSVLGGLERVGEVSCQLVVAAMSVLVLLQVVLRYVFASPLIWAEEASIFLMIWMAFVGAGVAVRKNSHVALELLRDKLPVRVSRPALFLSQLATLGFLIILAREGWLLALAQHSQRSPALGIPMMWPYLVLPLGACFIASQLVGTMLGQASTHASSALQSQRESGNDTGDES